MEETQTLTKINSTFSFQDTTATRKIFALRKRIRAVKGGTSASKTISILVWCIDYCQTKQNFPEVVTVASESFPHLDLGSIRDFKNIMKDRGYWKQDRWNETKHFYTFETGNTLEFGSFDTYEKAHGPRRDVLFLNECNNLPWIIVDQLITRTRKVVWMDWNPSEEFWFHEQIVPYRDDYDFLTLTYKDNEALDTISIMEIESHKHDENWWQVYGLGLEGATQERIYNGWTIVDLPTDGSPRLRVKGLDFGFTNDPAALVDVYEWSDGYLVDEQLYEKGMHNSDLAKAIGKKTVITIADSSEPKSISEIAMYGVNIIGSKKGKGSISHGIDTVQSKKIYVTRRSVNIIKEMRTYVFIKDKDGKITNEPRDFNNHLMDAIRYAIAFLNPVVEDEDEDLPPKREYETPSLSGSVQKSSSQPIPTMGVLNLAGHKDRMQEIMKNHKKADEIYESPIPWEKPGV